MAGEAHPCCGLPAAPDPSAGVLTPDVTGLPGAKYSLNALMRVRLGPYKEGETVCLVPCSAGSVCRPRREASPEALPAPWR